MSIPVRFEHVAGTRDLRVVAETIDDLLSLEGIPRTIVQIYLARGDRLEVVPVWTRLDQIPPDVDSVVVRALRNTLFDTVLPWAETTRPVASGVGIEGVALLAGKAVASGTVLDPLAARSLVARQVLAFVTEHRVADRGCVFAVSGGGDSNALANGLAGSLPSERLTAFTLVFRDVMPQTAATRAIVLCQELGISHRVYGEPEISSLLGLRTSAAALYEDFEAAFGDETIHFFGTFLILQAARAIAAETGFGDIAFGYNREDLLAELMFAIMNGRAPLAFPTRTMGEQRIVMPVWQAPKLLLDACHPAYSLENYRERDAHTTRQRSLAFFLGHSLDSSYPGFGQSVLTGAAQTFAGQFGELQLEPDLGVFRTAEATTETVQLVREVLSRHLPDRQK